MKEEAYKRISVNVDGYSWEHIAEEWLKDLPVMAYGEVKHERAG